MDVGLNHRIQIYQPEGPKSKKERYQGTKRAKVAHGIATNIDLSMQAQHRTHKDIDQPKVSLKL